MKKISWQGILAFTVTAIALWAGGVVIGADCNNEGLWTMGMKPASISVTNQDELQNAINANAAIINITNSITLTDAINFPESSSIDIRGNGQKLRLQSDINSSVIKYDVGSSGLGAKVAIKNLTITGGKGTGTMGGGGIYWNLGNNDQSTSLTLEDCEIINNWASTPGSLGGGIYFNSENPASYLKLLNCKIEDNKVAGNGGGISWNSAGTGEGGHLTVENSKIINNSAYINNSMGSAIDFNALTNKKFLNIINSEIAKNKLSEAIRISNGSVNIVNSAIYENASDNTSAISISGTSGNIANLKIFNSTIYGNMTLNNSVGVMQLNSYTSADINFCTITNNRSFGTAIKVNSQAFLDISNSIVTGNSSSEINSAGTAKSKGYNVFGANGLIGFVPISSDVSGKRINEVFGQNTIKVNRQGTPTVALPDGSPAINLVPASELSAVSRDQRGLPRPGSAKPALSNGDAGAFESGNQTTPPPDPDDPDEPDDPDPTPKQPAKLSTLVLSLMSSGTDIIKAEASGNWTVSSPGIIEISSSPFHSQNMSVASAGVSGDICYVKSLGKAGITTIKYENNTHIAYVTVKVSSIDIRSDVIEKINDINTGLAGSGVGVIVGGNISGDIDGIGTVIGSISSIDAQIDPNAPKMLCYEETGKSSAVIEVQVPNDGKNYMLPMGYTLSFSEDEIKSLSDSVERPVDMGKIFGSDRAAAAEEFFSVFVLQKEIRQGSRKGQLARLMGGSDRQQHIISPTDALNAGLLKISNGNRTFSIEFDFCVIDGDNSPKYNEEYKILVVGDGNKDGLIVDPLWSSLRSASSSDNIDGGTGCNAGFAIFALLFIPLIARKKR